MNRISIVIAAAALLVGAACLEVSEHDSARRPVIGGVPTPEGMYPATGALLASFDGAPLEFGCTGTLVAPTVVVTAAHCLHRSFVGENVPSFTLALDARAATAAEIVAGAARHVHPDFDPEQEPPEGVGKSDDIAVLILAEPIDDVPYERLPTAEEAAALAAGMPVELVGYGMTRFEGEDDWDAWEEAAGVKHHGEATMVEVGDWELWISEPGQQQNCFGDSGGPALVDLGSGLRMVGIVSRGPDLESLCGNGGIDTRVDAYLPWIYDVSGCGDQLIDCVGDPDAGDGDAAGCGCDASGPPAPWPLLGALPLWWLLWRRRPLGQQRR